MKRLARILCVVGVMGGSLLSAVDLHITNATNRDLLATARPVSEDGSSLTRVGSKEQRVFIENITPSDVLTIYWDKDGRLEEWAVVRIVLGGQREEPIFLTVKGSPCEGFVLDDVLGEPGEGGYNIQIEREKPVRGLGCPLK